MSQKTTGLYSFTQVPILYETFQRALGITRTRKTLIRDYIRPASGARILDLGCGPAAILPFLIQATKVSYIGIDLNAAHIASARTEHGDSGRFHAGDFASLKDELAGTVDLVICLGLLHHLEDDRVAELGRLAHSYLAPGGRFVAADPVFADGQAWIARRLAAADAGQRVRKAEGYRSLIGQAFAGCQSHVRHDLLRVPYSHCITVATKQ
ncbi:MAG: class I SAM-dependent methyltransferase [Hyphomicrobium sp.]